MLVTHSAFVILTNLTTFPNKWLRFQRQVGARPFILGHRGARAYAPENTLQAFERALADGADGVELDVRMSADGELFVSHDDTFAAIGQPPGKLSQLSAAQIFALTAESATPLPTLSQVLQLQAETGALFNIELKSDVPEPLQMARRVSALVSEHGGEGILLSSFDPQQVYLLAKALPHIPVCQLFAKAKFLSFRLGLMPILGVTGVNLRAELLTPKLMRKIRQRFQLINTWTVNSTEEARRVADLGVDAIITDDPAQILGEFS